MAEQEKKPAIAAQRKIHRFGNRAGQSGQKSTYKSKVIGLEEHQATQQNSASH
jgi:hypothetical protein